MNKKLFFAGFALLAAVSFTSCSTDTPIDITNPNGVAPDGSHAIGGAYDWTVTPKNVKQLDSLWTVDKDKVQANIEDSKTASILINVDNFTLESGKTIEIPELWSKGTKANGKVVSVTVSGNFKNADYQRADAIKNAATPKKQTKFPVLIDTKNLAGAEVNFDFEVEKFDLELTTPKARSTFSGNYTIGYLFAIAAEKLSATEFKSGTVEGLDYASTGDFTGTIAGVWVKTAPAAAIEVAAKGIKVGQNAAYTVFGKNVFVEANTELDTWYANDAGEDAQFKLGTVKFVTGATLTLGGTNVKGKAAADAIENIKGFDKDACLVMTQGIGDDLSLMDAVEKVTVYGGFAGNTITLEEDIFTDVEFNDPIIFDASLVSTFENVVFGGTLDIVVPEDNTALTFNAVQFDKAPVTIISAKLVENTVATTKTTTYQWIVSDASANTGYYQVVTKALPLTEYNKDQEPKEFSYEIGKEKLKFAAGSFTGDDAVEASKYRVVKVTVTTPAGKVTLIPEGTTVTMDKNCKFTGATTDAALNEVWGNKEYWDEECWYSVSYAGNDYVWKKATDDGSFTNSPSATGVFFVLIKK